MEDKLKTSLLILRIKSIKWQAHFNFKNLQLHLLSPSALMHFLHVTTHYSEPHESYMSLPAAPSVHRDHPSQQSQSLKVQAGKNSHQEAPTHTHRNRKTVSKSNCLTKGTQDKQDTG